MEPGSSTGPGGLRGDTPRTAVGLQRGGAAAFDGAACPADHADPMWAPLPGIDIVLADPAWRRALPRADALARRAAAMALAEAGEAAVAGAGLTILLADDRALRRLNAEHRGKDKPTNVLSFPAGAHPAQAGSERPLGDIVIALETTRAEARAAGKPLADHLAHLVIHGVLHLLGHDHERPAPARRMERLEVLLLARLGIADPYVAERRRA